MGEKMALEFLEFEKPIAELKAKIEELRHVSAESNVNIYEQINVLEKECESITKSIFAHLNANQIVQLARHPQRPHTLDYIERLFTDFDEMHGDRHYSKAEVIVGGIARFAGVPVVVLGHQKGRKTKDKLQRNFGMPRPEDFRKAQRLMLLAEKFHLPLLTFIDTPGAYPGIDAEERNQSEAIARSLYVMAQLKTPIISTVIGEGGSGGALAIGVADRVLMLQYSIYSVISPEGCASILWKDAKKAAEASESMWLTADKLAQLRLNDRVLHEPLGGAHRDIEQIAKTLKSVLEQELEDLQKLPLQQLLQQRYHKLMQYGLE